MSSLIRVKLLPVAANLCEETPSQDDEFVCTVAAFTLKLSKKKSFCKYLSQRET